MKYYQAAILLLSIVCLIFVFIEIKFTLRYKDHRNYDYFLGPGILFLMKLNNVMRCATYSGALVTSLFYNTNKVMVVYGITFFLNIAALVLLII